MQPPSKEALNLAATSEALKFVVPDQVLGSGSTVNLFVSLLRRLANRIKGAVTASATTATALRESGVRILDLNDVGRIPIYVDGGDEIDPAFALIKGGLSFTDPLTLDMELNQLPAVGCNGIFARRRADICISANPGGILVRGRQE